MTMKPQSPMSRLAFGEGASAAELRAALACGLAGVMLAAGCASASGQELRWWQWLILLIVAFDVVGGVAANATPAATRQYHRPGRPCRPLLFAAGHIQPLALALVIPGLGWAEAGALWLAGLVGVSAVIVSPRELKRAVSLGYCALALSLAGLFADPAGLEWLAPAFLLKLVAAHAVPWSLDERVR